MAARQGHGRRTLRLPHFPLPIGHRANPKLLTEGTMVERIMLLKLHDSNQRAETAKVVLSKLTELPDIEEVSVGLPADVAAAKSWDISVVLLFTSEASSSLTLESETFKAIMEALGPRVQVIKAWNFERLS